MSKAKNKGNGGAGKAAPNTNGEEVLTDLETKETSELDSTDLETKEVKTPKPKDQATLNHSKTYTIISLVTAKYLKEGKEYNVAGKLAEKMINNNQAKLKD